MWGRRNIILFEHRFSELGTRTNNLRGRHLTLLYLIKGRWIDNISATMALQTPSPTLYVSNLEDKTKKPGSYLILIPPSLFSLIDNIQNFDHSYTPCSPHMVKCKSSQSGILWQR